MSKKVLYKFVGIIQIEMMNAGREMWDYIEGIKSLQ
jgi:hypothetical protein